MFWNKNKNTANKTSAAPIRSPLAISLEPRMLFDGAVAATVADAATTTADASQTQSADDSSQHATDVVTPPAASSDQRQEIVFVDGKLQDVQQLIAGLPSGTEVVVLDSNKDGLQQIADYLKDRSDVDAIHLLSHGSEGAVELGNTWLNSQNIGQHSQTLNAIGAALASDGDILLYGCDTGEGTQGATLLGELARLTQADVAASVDATGAISSGGNWQLEREVGQIESASLNLEGYQSLLAAPADQNFDNHPTAPYQFSGAQNIDGVTYSLVSPAGGQSTITAIDAFFSITPADGSKPYGYDLALIFNMDENSTALPGAVDARIAATDGSEFRIASMEIDTGAGIGTSPNLTIKGYLNGVEVASDTVNTGVSDSTGSVTYTKNGVAAGFGGTLTFNSAWQYIDEIRITGTDTVIAIDDLNFEAAVLPSVAPSLSATATNPTFTENGSAVDLFSGITAATNDSGQTFIGAQLTVTNVSNGAAEILTIGGTSVALNNGNSGTIAGIGNYNVSVASGTATVTLSGMNRDNTQMGTLIDGITYRNTSDDPGSASRVVTITQVTDSGGSNNTASPNIASTVTVTPVNDAPTLTATGGTPTYTENGSAVDLFSGVSISAVESGQNIASITLSVSNLADGSSEILRIDGSDIALTNGNNGTTASNGIDYSISVVGGTATVTLSKAGGVNTAVAQTVVDGMSYRNSSDTPSTATRVVTLTGITDNGGTANGGVNGTVVSIGASVSVSAVNDAPIVTSTGGPSAFTEGGSSVVIDAGLTLSDVDNNTLSSATVSITGNFQSGEDILAFTNNGSSMGNITASYNAGTGVMTLTSAGATATLAQWQAALRSVTYSNGSEAPNTATRTISFVANDGQSDSTAATKTVSITAVNDAPLVTAPITIGVTEDTPSAITGISFSDVDAGSSSVTVTLSVTSGSLAATSGGGVTIGGTSSALTLTGSISNINTFIAGSNVSFTTAANSTADVTLTASINDGGNTGSGGAQSANDVITLQVTAINDAPTITAPGSISITEDAPGALTGISFADVDAGSGNVTVTLSVASGTLSATSGSGVTVGGTASALTLSGTITDINAFIAASGVSFITASNATANVTLTVAINDGGNSGSGGAQTDSTTVTLTVTAVNDAPVNSIPAAQSVDQDSSLVFNSGNGNLISISDVDAGSNSVRVTLTATNGLLTLGSTSGLSFQVGSGIGDATLTFAGSLADINNALNGLTFSPTGGYNGPASLQITSDDLGSSGSGGAQTDTDTLTITVNSLNPRITSVSSSTADGTYKVGDTITITTTFSEAVTVDTTGGIPSLLLETGSIDRIATYVSGSGSNTLTFSYTVQAGDISADLDYQSTAALGLNGATIRGATSNDAVLTLPTVGTGGSLSANKALVVDGLRPAATSITLSDTALRIGETATVTVTFNEQISGLDIADFSVANGSLSGLSTSDGGLTWTATFTPSANVSDATNLITLDNTGVMDQAGNIGSGTTDSVNYAIDTQRPTAAIVVTDTVLKAGETTTVTITFNEAVTGLTTADFSVANGTLSGLSSNDGGITWTATLTPSANANDTTNLITLDNTGYTDVVGNAGTGTTDSNNYAIDTQRPTATIVVTDTALKAGQGTTVTITFSEAVTGLTTTDFSVANGSLSGLSTSDGGLTWTATLTPSANVTDPTNLITLDNTGYTDAAGNTGTGTTDSNNYAIDSKAPAVTSVGVPANGTYVAGDALDFTVNFDEAVTVDTTGGTPRIAITLDTGGTVYANYLSGSGSSALVFRLTVANGQMDSNGISLGGSIDAHGGTLRDAAGNDSITTLNSVGSTTAVLVDAVAPQVNAISLDSASPTNASSVTFTVTFSEDVNGVDISDFSLVTSGNVNATLQSLTQIDPRTYQVTVDSITGLGNLGLNLNANGTGITDNASNAIASAFTGQAYTIGIPAVTPTPDVTGDPEFRTSDPVTLPNLPNVPLQPQIFGPPTGDIGSPLVFAPLFEQRTLGSSVPPLGNIFISNGALAPSFIAQVFTSSDSGGNGSAAGFLGFGGGDGGVFGSSTLSGIFGKESAPEAGQLKVFDGKTWGSSDTSQGLRGVFGAPTLSQQLHDLHQAEQRQMRELAQALGQFETTTPQA
ncbi:Ig-like domain-containing protein [Pseudomonas sp. GLN_6]|uniref:Ig-like domain-containing protein n=1 Tax=Pseudomonas sp. GLN_6 TaxID=3367183 RepID=UPI00370AC4DF